MNKTYVLCPYCKQRLKFITPSHLKLHNKTINIMKKEFPGQPFMCKNTIRKITKNSDVGEKQKKSIDFIKNYLKDNELEYKIISVEYIDSKNKLKWECNKRHLFFMSWDSFNQGHRCPTCFGTPKRTKKEIFEFLESINYKWIGNTYKSGFSKLKVVCLKDHTSEIRFDQLVSGHRCHECHNEWKQINFSGTGNPNWRGGISYEPYCNVWTDELKEYIKHRDNFKCMNPCCLKISKILVVHHIDYNKKNCNIYNLITLCNSCNTVANFSRRWHKKWYEAIIFRRYVNKL